MFEIKIYCEHCGKEFIVNKPCKKNQRFCSRGCASHLIRHVKLTQENINKIINLYSYDKLILNEIAGKFNVTKEAIRLVLLKNNVNKIVRKRYKKPLKHINCEFCNKEIEVPDNKQNKTRRFCSSSCMSKFRWKFNKEKMLIAIQPGLKSIIECIKNGHRSTGRPKTGRNSPEHTCNYCGKKFNRYITRQNQLRFCNRRCYWAFLKSSGAGSPAGLKTRRFLTVEQQD